MKRLVMAAASAAFLSACLVPPAAAAADAREEKRAAREEQKRLGSLYVRCDGQPNNMSDGESIARLVGALTLLALFAPEPESPDPSKRLFGEAGVDACTQLLDGEKAEGNAVRRIPLILGRAIHQIEAKNYDAAIADVTKARAEAAAIGLVGNPYFDRSMGLSFGNIEAEALLRLDDPLAAQAASLARMNGMSYSFVPILTANEYSSFIREMTPEAERMHDAESRIWLGMMGGYASRLEETGRFADAADKREALISAIEELKPEHAFSSIYASAAISHALAGNWADAAARGEFARSNLAARRAEGVPEEDASRVVELLDLYDLLVQFNNGETAVARRSFAARSQWLEPSLGAVMETNRRLREGAGEGELFGSLARSADDMWSERRDAAMALKLQRDTNNDTLFDLIIPYAKVSEFEGRSKDVWRTAKSKMMSAAPEEDTGLWRIYAFGSRQTAVDAIMLHAALQAQERGKQGFTMMLTIPDAKELRISFTYASVRFVNRDEEGANPSRFIPAAEVIAELSPLIPSPEELKARKKKSRTS